MKEAIKNKSVYRLKYKLYMKIKDGNIIGKDESLVIREIFDKICGKHGIECKEMTVENLLVSIELTAKPETELLKFINAYKSALSRKLKTICSSFDFKNGFWEKGYLLITIGEDNKNLLEKYISNKK